MTILQNSTGLVVQQRGADFAINARFFYEHNQIKREGFSPLDF